MFFIPILIALLVLDLLLFTVWALQWPITIISTLVEDVLIKLGKHLSRLFDYLFNRMARKIITRAFG